MAARGRQNWASRRWACSLVLENWERRRWDCSWCWRIGRGGGEIVAGAGKPEMFSLFSSLPPPEHHLLCNNKLKFYSEFTRFTDEDIKTQRGQRFRAVNTGRIWASDLCLFMSKGSIPAPVPGLGDARSYSCSSVKCVHCRCFFNTQSNA